MRRVLDSAFENLNFFVIRVDHQIILFILSWRDFDASDFATIRTHQSVENIG